MRLLNFFFAVILMTAGVLGYNIPIMRKRQVDMRSFSLYDFPEDYYMTRHQEVNRPRMARRSHYINPKSGYITAFYPIYDFGRRRRR